MSKNRDSSIPKKCVKYLFRPLPVSPDEGESNEGNKLLCLLCEKSITWKGSKFGYSNPMSHLKNKHSSSYEQALKEAISNNGELVQSKMDYYISDGKTQKMYDWLNWMAEFDIPYRWAEDPNFLKYVKLESVCHKTLVHYALLSCHKLDDESNSKAQNQYNSITTALKRIKLEWDDVLVFIADNTNVNPAIAKLGNRVMIGCKAHLLALAVKKSSFYLSNVENPPFESALVKVIEGREDQLDTVEEDLLMPFLVPDDDDDDDDDEDDDNDYAASIIAASKRRRIVGSSSKYIPLDWIPTSTCEVERLFSVCRHVFSDWRKSMLDTTLENAVYLRVNRGLWDINTCALALESDMDVADALDFE